MASKRKMSYILSFIMLFLFVFIATAAHASASEQSDRSKQNFNLGWKYYKGDINGAEAVNFDDSSWSSVVLPHTFQITDYMATTWYRGFGWYRKDFTLDSSDSGKRIQLFFEGAKTVTEVWVNGRKLDTHYGGYKPFNYDITDYVQFGGNNVVAVRVDNRYQQEVPPEKPDNSYIGFNMFGGIYRDVYLIKTNKLYIPESIHSWNNNWIDNGGVFVTSSNISKASASVQVKTWVKNTNSSPVQATVVSKIVDANNQVMGADQSVITVAPKQVQEFTHNVQVTNPNLWAPWNPYLYKVKTTVLSGTEEVDDYDTTFGIRKTEWTKTQGFFLNDHHVRIFGVNHHQDWPFIGDAVPNNQLYLDAKRIKEAGANFVRDAHYMHDQAFMSAADELGLMQWAEIPGWGNTNPSSFGERWMQGNKDALIAMIRYARNHPSIVIWGAGINEMQQIPALEAELNDIAHREDPSRATSMGRNYNTSNNIFDVYGRNVYTEPQWNEAGLQHRSPDPNSNGLIITEHTGHTYETWRDAAETRLIGHALAAQKMTELGRNESYVHGSLIWEMHDHHHQISIVRPHGLTDAGGVPKFAYYWHQSQSAGDNYDGSVNPMVFIANYWMPSSPTKVTVFSNAEQVRLSKWNGSGWTEFQTKSPQAINVAHPHFEFELGSHDTTKLKAEGLIGGKVVATHIVQEPGTPATVEVTADTIKIDGNGSDISKLTFYIKDRNGTVVPYSTNNVRFHITGPGKLIGGPNVSAVSGANIILVQSTGMPGEITVTASSDGLESDSIQIMANDVGISLPQEPESANLALNRPVSFSSEQTTPERNQAFNANDGNLSTRWAASGGTLPQWWQVDLGTVRPINRTNITFNQQLSRTYGYKIEVSKDNQTFIPVVSDGVSIQTGDTENTFDTIEARYVRITINRVTPSNFWASIIEAQVFYDPEPEPEQTAASLTRVTEGGVFSNQPFTIHYGLTNAINTYAQDITVLYDEAVMTFVSARSLIDGVRLVNISDHTPGKLRLIIASEGPDHAVTGDTQLIELSFVAKPITQAAEGTIEVTSAVLGDEHGVETMAITSIVSIPFTPVIPGVPGDMNNDGKVSIGDLGMIAAHYGKDSTSPDWAQIKHMDVSGNGSIDIADLAMIARAMVE